MKLIGEHVKRARLYLVMSIEARDIRECCSTLLCRVAMHCSTHQYKLPVNFFTNPISGGSL